MSTDILCFYSKSADKPPGKGASEQVQDISQYAELAKLAHWRRTLSNFDVAPFTFRCNRYNTIEHVFQAMKTALVDGEKAAHFTLDSGHTIGQGDGRVAQAHRKYAMLDKSQIAIWATLSDHIMAEAAAAKYAEPANNHARQVLVATNKAQLMHISRGHPLKRFVHLEQIREALIK